MEIAIFLAAGFVAELVLMLVRPLRGAMRGLVCWSVAAVVLAMCCVVYFAGISDITLDLMSAARCVGGAGAVILLAVVIELFSPSRRSRRRSRQESPREDTTERSEGSLNIVLSVAAGILCAAALALFLCGERDTAVVLLAVPAAGAIRQTFWFMRLNGAEKPAGQREKLEKRISCGKYRL